MKLKTISLTLEHDAIKKALAQFQSQMQEAYATGQLIDLVPAFIPEDKNLFENKDFKNLPQLQEYSKFLNHNDPDLDQMEHLAHLTLEQLNRPDFYAAYSHLLVFQHALAYDDLLPLVLDICEELIAYAMKVNSSNELFFSTNQYFGIGILVILALHSQEYSYLIGDFIARDSDYNQIKYHVAPSVYFLLQKFGYSRDNLKLLAHVRFNDFHIALDDNFYTEDDREKETLLEYFTKHRENYEYYKECVVNAFKKYPQSLAPDFEEEQTVIERFFDIIVDQYDVEMETRFEEQPQSDEEAEYVALRYREDSFEFHGKTLQEEIQQFDRDVFNAIKDIPRKDFYYSSGKNYGEETLAEISSDSFYQEYEAEYDYEINNEFFLTCFANGQEILDFIEKGTPSEVLQSLQQVPIRKLAFDHKLQLFKRLEYYGSGDFRLSENLAQEVSLLDILEHFVAPYLNPDSYGLDGDEQSNHPKALRCFQVLVKLTGKNRFSPADIEEICDRLELMDEATLLQNYDTKKLSEEEFVSEVYAQVNDAFTESFGQNKLRSIHRLYQKNPAWFTKAFTQIKKAAVALQDPDILAVSPGMRQEQYAMGSQLMAVAFVLYTELQDLGNTNDPHLIELIDFYQENLFETILWQIASNEQHVHYSQPETKTYLETSMEQLRNYLIPPTPAMPPKALMQKLMTDGIASLTAEEQQLIQSLRKGNTAPSTTLATAQEIINTLLVVQEDEDAHDSSLVKARNIIFHSENAVMALSSIPWVARVAPANVAKNLLKAYLLFTDSAPLKLLYTSFKEFTESGEVYNAQPEAIIRFEDMMMDLKIPRSLIFATQILVLEKRLDYNELENLEDDDPLKKYYHSLVTQFSEMDIVDEDQSPMFAAMEKKRKEAMQESLQYLEVPRALKFLKQVHLIKPSNVYIRLAQTQFREELWQAAKRNVQRPDKASWELNEEEKTLLLSKAKLVTDTLYAYFWEETSLENALAIIREHYKSNVDLHIDPISEFCYGYDKEFFTKCFNLLFTYGNEGDYYGLYNAIRYNKPRAESDNAIFEFDNWAQQLGCDELSLFRFYLREYKSRVHQDFEENFFAQIVLRRLAEIQKHPALKKLKGYQIFMKYKEDYELNV